MSDWIDITDRLPPQNVLVLVRHGAGQSLASFDGVRWLRPSGSTVPITHWKPYLGGDS